MIIQKNCVVSVTYELYASGTHKKNDFVERADKDNPLTFLYGIGQMIVAFETHLKELKKGDKFEFDIAAQQAYGQYDLNAIVNLPKEVFKTDGMADKELLKVGNVIPMMDNEGNRLDGKVLEINDANIKMDFNHPLAGNDLHFVGEVLSVRMATPDEISHGHIHDGNHHH